jgi:hypothetical protein
MDNAAKALLIAGGILIGVLIISIGMYLYTSFRSAYSDSMNLLDSYQIARFNSVLTQYGIYDGESAIDVTGDQVWNILSYVDEAQNDDYSIATGILSTGDITVENYRKKLFFTDTCLNSFKYTYKYGSDGVINEVSITRN